jgi:tRNA dimethylallyltransferase
VRVTDAPPVVLLMGPTASGKTELAIELAARLPMDVVSVDSALVYRGMNIGTAKPAPEVLERCPHRLINICDPTESYSAGRFVVDATREIREIHGEGRIPLLAGGTMLYFRAIQEGLADLPPADPAVRAAIDAEAATAGWPAMHAALRTVDPEAAARIEPNDAQRIQRALEVYRVTGVPLSRLQAGKVARRPKWRFVKIGLWPADREALRARIARRFREMMEAGLAEEVAALRARPDLGPDLPSMRAVGYRQLWAWHAGECSREEAVAQAITATHQLAKRQLTWMRAEVDLEKFEIPSAALVDDILQSLKKSGLSAGELC